MTNYKKGKIIVIEGIDGSGKETQSKLLKSYLESLNKKVLTQSFPNYKSESSGPVKLYLGGSLSKTANEIDAYQSSVLFTVDRFCTMEIFKRQVTQETYVIFDRYVSSNMLHQGGKIRDKKELEKFLKWLDDFEYNLMKLPRPDIIFFLDMPVNKSIELAKRRINLKTGTKEDIHEKDKNHLIHAYETGKFIANILNWTIINCVNDIGELKSEEEINKEIQYKLNI